jgi:hypothetical protein
MFAISHHTTYSTKEQDQVMVLDKNINNSIIADGNLHSSIPDLPRISGRRTSGTKTGARGYSHINSERRIRSR